MLYRIGLLILLFFNVLEINAQESIRFERITIKDGLSQNTVTCILQDRMGYLWIGTLDGLNKYNGLDFEVYKNEIDNPRSLQSNLISALFEDSEGSLWVGTRRGLHYFNKAREEFTLIVDSTLNPNGNRVTSIVEDKNKQLWISYEGNGIAKLDLKASEKKLQSYVHIPNYANSLPNNGVYALFYHKNLLWIGAETPQLISFDTEKEQFQTYSYPTFSKDADALLHISADEKGEIWIGTATNGIFLFNDRKKEFLPFYSENSLLKGYSIRQLFHLPNGDMWIASQGNGLIKYNKSKNIFIPYQFDATNPMSLSNNDINSIFQDKAGLFWIGTYNGGLNKYDPDKARFKHYQKEANNPNSLSANSMRGIFEDSKGRLWVGTTLGGLNMIDRQTGKFTLFSTKSLPPISEDRINMIVEDKYGNIWVSTLNKGLDKITFDSKTNLPKVTNIQYIANNPNSLINNGTRGLYYDSKEDVLWIGTTGGLSKLDLQTGSFENHYASNHPDSLSHATVKYIVQDTDENILWIATEGGLNKYDKAKKKFKRYVSDVSNPKSLSNNILNCLLVTKQGNLWVGTVGGGLNYFDKKTETFTYYTEKNGLPNNVIYGILEDEKSNLWLSTNRGLAKFNPKTLEVYNYFEEDGLQSNEFNLYAFHKNKKGEMFFGGINGFNTFLPSAMESNSFSPNVVLTDFKIANKSVRDYDNSPLKAHISLTKELTISYEDNVFSLDFVSLDFKNPTKIKYQYKMEGFDKDWRETNYKRRTDTYTNLPEGTYFFKVRATNSDGLWSKNEVNLKITIEPPFWKTTVFRVLTVILLLGFLFYFYQQRVRQVEMQKKKLENLVTLRTNEISRQKEEINIQKNELEKLLNDIKTLTLIGQEITNALDLQTIISKVYENVNQLMAANGLGIGLYDKENRQIVFEGFIENGKTLTKFTHALDDERRFSVWCFLNQREVFLNDVESEYKKYITARQSPIMGKAAQSMIYVPLFIENKIIGVLTVQSLEKNSYHAQHLDLLKNLASYIAIAIDNANNYRQLEIAKRTIEEKNRYTTDSIRYAQTIQHSILPTEEMLDSCFGFQNHFVIYKAKDLVSGDFYWCKKIGNRIFFAVVDCTGHGVPGAFMSMIGSILLNEITSQKPYLLPAEILEEMHEQVRSILRQEDKYNDDGMDMGLCLLENVSHGKKLTFSGAQFPLYRVNSLDVVKYRGENRSIGGKQREKHIFTNTVIEDLQKGEMIYLLTDGFTDQNDLHRIKYGSSKLQEKLKHIYTLPLFSQKEILEKELEAQLTGTEQRDDITFLGIRI
ncbi:two-component regulator propeller domain-containing protein [Thermoflexibacter ruber]|uniref:Ligand-binding sensor domain-containing protein n=1 Tax=Thermoflexibacter ruber TaxID=1003 RepID=A0A1I2EC09_9BACT|nr:two-component regulator propeller domain-containing protein [Thermoflexibacter ruber]SFE90126.1 ligand-binding sensor domain-containing protein [Thermoflexibacter ruber]